MPTMLSISVSDQLRASLEERAANAGLKIQDYSRAVLAGAKFDEKRRPGRPKAEKPESEPELTVVETEYSRGRDLCVLINPPKDSPPIWVESGGGEKYYQNGFPIWSDESKEFLREWRVQNGVKAPAGAS